MITELFYSLIPYMNGGSLYCLYSSLYNNQINARALIGQSAVGYCAGKPTEKSRVF